jgi:CheY-like chemotaxis protein
MSQRPDAFIIGMTGYDDRDMLNQCYASGMQKCVNKPFRESDFRAIFEMIPARSSSAQPATSLSMGSASSATVTASPSPGPGGVPEFDFSLLEEVGSMRGELLGRWKDNMEQWFIELEGILRGGGDVKQLGELLHTIRGTSGQIGAVTVSEIAHDFERQSFDKVKMGMGLLRQAYFDTLELLEEE